MLKQTTLRALAPLSLALALATGGLALSAPALANQAARPTEAVSASATLTAPAPLVNAAELKTLLGQPGVRVLDIRADKDYAGGHIPGAVNTPYGKYRGPKENPGQLPAEAALTQVLQAAGVITQRMQGRQLVIRYGRMLHQSMRLLRHGDNLQTVDRKRQQRSRPPDANHRH